MGNSKMKECKSCGAKIAASAKVCPGCGAKNKKPIYKRVWFIVLVVIVVFAGISGAMGGSDPEETAGQTTESKSESKSETKEKITYTKYEVAKLMDDLEENALKAKDTYNEQYVELAGKLGTIDSSGDYITIEPDNDDFVIISVQCYIQDEEQKNIIKELSAGDSIVVKGQITDVGEVMGYSLDMDHISKK